MLISTNKKNNIAKSIALMLALVLAFSCILTACADKTARKDVEDLKATVDTLGKDVDTVEGVANSAVTNEALTKALADALAKYLDKEGHDADIEALLAEYTKTADAEKFVTDLLKGYYTQAQIDEMLKGYYTKAEVDTLIANFVSEEDVPGFIADYLGTPEAKEAIAELLEDTYMDLNDWNAATAEVLTAIANVSRAIAALDDNIYTVADYATYVALVEEAFEIYIDEEDYLNYEQLVIDILRATDPSEFDYIEELADATEAILNAADAIKAINDKIDALKTASAGKIDTDDKAALDEIKAMIVDFDAKYGFNATLVTVDVATADFKVAFCGATMAQDALDAKLVVDNNYDANIDYVEDGGLKIDDYLAMQGRYDDLMAWAAEIDAMIVNLVAEIGEEQSISDDQLDLIKAVIKEVLGDANGATDDAKAGFKAANNGITTPIKGYNTYLYYEWLAGKRMFDDNKIEAKAALDAYAAETAAKFDSSAMNKDVANIVKDAKTAIDAINYASYKTYQEAKAALDAYIVTIKKDIDETLYTYCFADTQLKAVAAITAKKTALEEANDVNGKYDTVIDLADDYIEAINAIVVDETAEYPYTAAYTAVVSTKTAGETAIDLAKAKIDAKLRVLAYAQAYLTGTDKIFDGVEKNFDDIVASVIASAQGTYSSIDAVTVITGIDAVEAAAKLVVDQAAYTQKLNVAMSNVQATIRATAKAAKLYADENPTAGVDYTAIGALADNYVIEIFAIEMSFDATDAAKDSWAEAFATANAKVVAKGEAFNAETVVDSYLDLVRV